MSDQISKIKIYLNSISRAEAMEILLKSITSTKEHSCTYKNVEFNQIVSESEKFIDRAMGKAVEEINRLLENHVIKS